jgi:hypothetical protein
VGRSVKSSPLSPDIEVALRALYMAMDRDDVRVLNDEGHGYNLLCTEHPKDGAATEHHWSDEDPV